MAKRGSLKWKQNISRSLKGRESPKYWSGKKFSKEHLEKLSRATRGKNNPRYGIKLSENLKKKIGEAVRKYYQENGTEKLRGLRPQTSKTLRGHRLDEETKRKIGRKSRQRIGFKSSRWKGGITSLNRIIRNSVKHADWVKLVFERDNWVCQGCGQRGGRLEAHHIKSLSYLIKEYRIKTRKEAMNCKKLWEIENGITYCVRCHGIIDKFRKRTLGG